MPNVNETGNDLNRELLGCAIAGARVTAGYTQKGLCDLLREIAGIEMATSKLCRVEKGNQTPDLNTLAAIAIVLGRHNWRRVLAGFIDASLSDTLRNLSSEYESENESRELLTLLTSALQTIHEGQSVERLSGLVAEKIRQDQDPGDEVADWLDGQVSARKGETETDERSRMALDMLRADIVSTVAKAQVIKPLVTNTDSVYSDMAQTICEIDKVTGKYKTTPNAATPVPAQGAVAIDEPERKEQR